jgi:hypothetical protein
MFTKNRSRFLDGRDPALSQNMPEGIASAVREAKEALSHQSVSLIFCSDELPHRGIDTHPPPAADA